tara:strand:- start:90878 stop:91135 length:258 start_codon:yes stop_codon:yes gene_type:complete
MIKIYGADWCSDCINIKNYLDSIEIEYEYILINSDEKYTKLVMKVNNGKKIIPTIEINGEFFSNPNLLQLSQILKNTNSKKNNYE